VKVGQTDGFAFDIFQNEVGCGLTDSDTVEFGGGAISRIFGAKLGKQRIGR
jgi:hypothetical protein